MRIFTSFLPSDPILWSAGQLFYFLLAKNLEMNIARFIHHLGLGESSLLEIRTPSGWLFLRVTSNPSMKSASFPISALFNTEGNAGKKVAWREWGQDVLISFVWPSRQKSLKANASLAYICHVGGGELALTHLAYGKGRGWRSGALLCLFKLPNQWQLPCSYLNSLIDTLY